VTAAAAAWLPKSFYSLANLNQRWSAIVQLVVCFSAKGLTVADNTDSAYQCTVTTVPLQLSV